MDNKLNRIMVIGCCGAGKSTLSFQLVDHFDLPLFHLDQLFWKPGWIESERDEWIAKHQEVIDQDRWIIDGNFKSTMSERLERADLVICMDLPRWKCLWGVLKRWFQHRGKTRPDMNEGCKERLDWEFTKYVWDFHRDQRPGLLKQLAKFENKKIHLVRSRKEANSLLKAIISENG